MQWQRLIHVLTIVTSQAYFKSQCNEKKTNKVSLSGEDI